MAMARAATAGGVLVARTESLTALLQRRTTFSSVIGCVLPMQAGESRKAARNAAMEALVVRHGMCDLTFCTPDRPSVPSQCCLSQRPNSGGAGEYRACPRPGHLKPARDKRSAGTSL